MPNFDLARTYQAVLFFDGPARTPEKFAQRLSAQIASNGLSLGLKLRAGKQVVSLTAGGPTQATNYESPSGIWTATLSAERLDVYFKALGFEETQDATPETSVTARDMVARLVPNFEALAHTNQWRVNRVALVGTGEASGDADSDTPIVRVAREFFNSTVCEAAAQNRVPDLTARVNVREEWPLADGHPNVFINCIRTATASAEATAEGGARLTWQIDVNTAPDTIEGALDGAALRTFFARAAESVESGLSGVRRASP